MRYKILEARIEYKDSKLIRVTVLIDCSGNQSKPFTDVRAIFATDEPSNGYMSLATDEISSSLLQEVAGYGMETSERDKIFQNWKKKHITHKK